MSGVQRKHGRILFVRNLPYTITAEEVFGVFGKYGAIRQVRVGSATDTRGTAFVVYEETADARAACTSLSGFNVGGRYLVVHFFSSKETRQAVPVNLVEEEARVADLRARVAAGEVGRGGGGGGGGAGAGAGAGSRRGYSLDDDDAP